MIGNDQSGVMSTGDETTRQLCVEFEVELAPTSTCPLGEFTREITSVRQQHTGEHCHTDLTIAPNDCGCEEEDCTVVVHRSSTLERTCPCTVFTEHGCVSQILGKTGEKVIIETYLPDRELLTDLVADLKAVVDGLALRRLKRIGSLDPGEKQTTVTLELFELTEKQREAAATAVAAGYYSQPREQSLGDLAAELDISESALSQRLSAVESKLATSAFERKSAD